MIKTAPLTITLLTLSLTTAALADWPRFLGPQGAATANDPAAQLTWSDSKNIAWETELPGPGNSSPIVIGNDIFITCYSGYALERSNPGEIEKLTRHLLRIDAKNGKILWDQKVKAVQPEDTYKGYITEHGYASNTPVSDGVRVFVHHGKSGVYAYDMNGKQLWQKDVGRDSSNKRWGSASSPILHKNLVIVNAAEESQTLYAFDKVTGEEKWKAEGSQLQLTYGTPRIINGNELLLAVPNEIWGLNPDTGKMKWLCETPFGGNISPSVVYGDGTAFAFGGFPKKGSVAVKTGGKGDVTDEHRLWVKDRTPYVSTPVYHAGHLYWVSKDGIAECQNATTGETVYKERLKSSTAAPKFYASPVLVNDTMVMVSRNAGTFTYRAGTTFQQTGQNVIAKDDSEFNGTPAIANGTLYLRSNQALYAIGK